MKHTVKRGFSMLLALILCLNLVSVLSLTADAADYIPNWGSRGTVATYLSQNAQNFYAENSITYTQLAALSGGTQSTAPSSALYTALQNLMKNIHAYETSYNATKELYQYTDCQNGGGKISAFYTGIEVGPTWDGSFNREHTWPQSKGVNGNDEDDIMMLRPSTTSENSSRGNKAYGESDGYFDPNEPSNGRYNLHGDVARIFLYVYVRWGIVNGNGQSDSNGNPYTTWGSNGVMESLEVLLKWMEEDPVDTWELGRNDSVESITGTRNVFVDYPELAFLLFNQEIPVNMMTPSGSTMCSHTSTESVDRIPATCTKEGHEAGIRCTKCGTYTQGGAIIPMVDHVYVNGVCSCGAKEPVVFERLTQLKTGDVVAIVAPAYNKALSTQKVATHYNLGVDISAGYEKLASTELFEVTVNSDGSYTFATEDGTTLAMANEHNSLTENDVNDRWTLTAVSGSNGLFHVKNTARGTYLEWYSSKNNWSTYNPNSLDDQFEIAFYAAPTSDDPVDPPVDPDDPVDPPVDPDDPVDPPVDPDDPVDPPVDPDDPVDPPVDPDDPVDPPVDDPVDPSETNPYVIEMNAAALGGATSVWLDGKEYPVLTEDGETVYIAFDKDTNPKTLVVYTYNDPNAKDMHTQYPTGMKVWTVSKSGTKFVAKREAKLDNLLQYSGCSIRITGKKGIRMITSISKETKTALTGKGIDGYTLLEYGTLLGFASELDEENALVLGKSYAKSNYAYKKGVADPVFKDTGKLVQYTNVLVGFTNDQCKDDIAMRPYIILQNSKGEQITIYGGVIYRSIGYIAYQNRTVFNPGTNAYNFVWEIIHHVYGKKYDADYKG